MEVRIYTTYGDCVANTMAIARTGYAGAVIDFDLPWYLLGVRFYVPWLRRFISPDAASPFGVGGFNRYAYCSGDPINRIDPSGNASFGWLGKLLGHLMGAAGNAARTVVQATPTSALTAISSVAQTLSVATTIGATVAAMDGSPAAGILGLIAGASGMAGVGLGVAGQSVSKGARASRSSGMLSGSTGLAAGYGQRSEIRGNPADPWTNVMKSTLNEPGNRVVVNYEGPGLRNMSALQRRFGPPMEGRAFALVPGTVTWINDHGGEVVGFDSRVTGGHIVDTVRSIDRGNGGKRIINLFVGVHGNGSGLGDNWNGNSYRTNLHEYSFFSYQLNTLRKTEGSSTVVVWDMASMPGDKFMHLLTRDDAINLLGWCYSVADEKANQARISLGEKGPFHYRTYTHMLMV